MTPSLPSPPSANASDRIVWVEAPPPEIETSECFDIVARWVMEVGTWVNEAAFCPVIRFTARSAQADSKKISKKSSPPQKSLPRSPW